MDEQDNEIEMTDVDDDDVERKSRFNKMMLLKHKKVTD